MTNLTDPSLSVIKEDLTRGNVDLGGATVVVAVYDHSDDKLYHMTMDMMDETLARSDDVTITNAVLEQAMRNVLTKWRGRTWSE